MPVYVVLAGRQAQQETSVTSEATTMCIGRHKGKAANAVLASEKGGWTSAEEPSEEKRVK